MVWEVERRGRRSTLVGAAHFFPRHFRRDLRRLIGDARIVLLEGPLDEAATRKVLEAGPGPGGDHLYRAAREQIRARPGLYSAPLDLNPMLRDPILRRPDALLEPHLS